MNRLPGHPLLALAVALLGAVSVWAQEGQRSSLQVTVDEDGDVAVVMDTESIRMTILPAYQSCISSFIFKPTGNDTLARQTIKFLHGGQGLLQDNFWEQDWRFSELRHKWYDFKIVSQGPDELASKFWTTSVGWLQGDKSGVISDLISNIRIERTVRMPVGKPYFLCDVTLSIDMAKDKTGHAKLPQFWVHNSSIFADDLSDEYQRPHVLGVAEQTKRGRTVSGDYVYAKNVAQGWSSHTSPQSKEGIVYLMDPAYVQSLYNCGNSTLEWFADNMLITRERPLKTRIYILPVIGLNQVHFADPHMILKLEPRITDDGAVELRYSALPSYRKIKRITFDTVATYGFHERQPREVRGREPMPVVRNLRVESPRHAVGTFVRPDGIPFTGKSPLLFDVAARVEFFDRKLRLRRRTVRFQYFHLGAYPTRKNYHLQDGQPLVVMKRIDARPWIPSPGRALEIDRNAFRVFLLGGPHVRHYGIRRAIRDARTTSGKIAWDGKDDAGYTVGFTANTTGLTNFPYDYERLFGYRVLINNNSQTDVLRLVGQSILAGFLGRGGGYITFGGEAAYVASAPEGHALNAFEPVVYRHRSIAIAPKGKPARLKVLKPNHPIFKGNGKNAPAIDLRVLPQALSWHRLALKRQTAKPFMHDPHEKIALVYGRLPADLRKAVEALPTPRRRRRQEVARDLFESMSNGTQQQLLAAVGRVFKGFPAGLLRDGVFAPEHLGRVNQGHLVDLREAFLDADENDKETLNAWIDANFGEENVVYFDALSAELQAALAALVRQAIAGDGVFRLDDDRLLLPDEQRPELASLLKIKHDELPATSRPEVLMELIAPDGKTYPFLVETVLLKQTANGARRDPEAGRCLAFVNAPFGDKADFSPDTVPYWEWDQWERLVGNAILYAGSDL